MDAYATLQDYCTRAGVALYTGLKAAQVSAKLGDVSSLMRSKLPPDFTPDPDTARTLCVSITSRWMANPGGYRQRTWGQYSESLDQDGGLYITDDEIAQLLGQGAPGDPAPQAYTLTMADHGLHWAHAPGLVSDPWYDRY